MDEAIGNITEAMKEAGYECDACCVVDVVVC